MDFLHGTSSFIIFTNSLRRQLPDAKTLPVVGVIQSFPVVKQFPLTIMERGPFLLIYRRVSLSDQEPADANNRHNAGFKIYT